MIQTPLYHPKDPNLPAQIIQKDSYGRPYILIPSGVRCFSSNQDHARVTFSVRRMNPDGTIKARIRMSKKDRLRAGRAAKVNNSQPLQAIASSPRG